MFICCVCLTFEESLFPIVQEYVESFRNCTGIHATKNDFLCPKCIERLKEAEIFRNEAINGYKDLQDRVQEAHKIIKDEPVDEQVEPKDESFLEVEALEEMVEYVVAVTSPDSIQQVSPLPSHSVVTNLEFIETNDFKTEPSSDVIDTKIYDEENMEEEYLSEAFEEETAVEETIVPEISQTDDFVTKQKPEHTFKVPSIRSIKAKEAWTDDAKKNLIKNCPYCFYYSKNKTEMTSHIQDHIAKNGGVECDHCSRMFRTKQLIKEHLIRIYKGGYNRAPPIKRPKQKTSRIHICDWCDTHCPTKEILYEHTLLTHTENPLSYFCNICLKSFEKKSTLKLHVYNKHTDRALIKYHCSFCSKTFKSKRSLEYHETGHTGNVKFTCHICSKGIKTKIGLEDHLLIHTGEKNFPCNVCEKLFRSKALLRSHMVLHTNNFKHTCEVCGYKFRRATNLSEHMAVHSDIKNFVCSLCKTLFKTKASLKRHMKKHSKKLGLEEIPENMEELIIKTRIDDLNIGVEKIEEVT